MKIVVLNKVSFDESLTKFGVDDSNVESYSKTFFISINDSMGTSEKPYFKKNHSNVLNMFFDDIEEAIKTKYGVTKPFSEDDGKELLNFITANIYKTVCIVHCSAGISRSGAVGLFINDYSRSDYSEFKKENPYIQPNQLVLRTLNRLYRNLI